MPDYRGKTLVGIEADEHQTDKRNNQDFPANGVEDSVIRIALVVCFIELMKL
jgi:hypothetical protein